MHPETPALSFISAALSLVPVIWYLHARNIAAVAIGIWLATTNLKYAVDALIWAENSDIAATVWCDISTAFVTGSRIALPAACLSIFIHLERLASFCQIPTPRAKRRRIMFECLMCFGLPVVYTGLHLIVQPRRFDLFYGFGCRPATYPSITTIVLVMVPPLFLAVATIVYAGIVSRHFIVHGVQFYGKRGSISSLTRNLYFRLVGMALLEAILSAILVAVVMWGVLSPGIFPIGNMTWHLNEVLVWGLDMVNGNVRTMLEVEWSVTVVQSFVFFGLFACRMEAVREAWEQIRASLRLLRRLDPSTMLQKRTSEQMSMSTSVPTFPMTVVDLSLVIPSSGMLTSYGPSMDKLLPSVPDSDPSCAPPLVEDAPEDSVISAGTVPAMVPLESPSRASAIPSSHNSLESNFDPSWLILSPDAWPQTPTNIPTRPPRCSWNAGYVPREEDPARFDIDGPFPRVEQAVHLRPSADAVWTKPSGHGVEKRYGIYVTVMRQTRFAAPTPPFFAPCEC